MGHRALVAVETPEGYALYRDRWGGQALVTGDDPSVVAARAVASGRPVGSGLGVDEVLEALDPQEHEALIVHEGSEASAYAVVWLGLVLAAGVVENGFALVPLSVGDAAQLRRLRRHLRAARGPLGDAVDAGTLSGETAVAWLCAALDAHPAVPRETVWFGPDDTTGGRVDHDS